jgi:adenine-specific DNA-methyltransferase
MPTLHWIGKDKIINHHQEVPYKVLDHEYGFSANGKTETPVDSGNLIINGDNLEALKSLLPKYEGKVNCIYIDPPYNTGNESWVYNDNVNSPKIKKWLGKVVGKESEDLTRHDKWLCMMYPRLKLLHKLLAKDGAIFISIDDNEQANLKLMMDEIFGVGNFIGRFIWKKKKQPSFLAKHIANITEFIFVYGKNSNLVNKLSIDNVSDETRRVDNATNDIGLRKIKKGIIAKVDVKIIEKGVYQNKTMQLEFLDDVLIEDFRTTNKQGDFDKFCDEDLLFITRNFGFRRLPTFDEQDKKKTVVDLLLDWGDNQDSDKELQNIFKVKPFDYPKPSLLISNLIKSVTYSKPNSIILDSFAGSGTTAHAVLNLNKQDGGNRKFILIEMEDYAETITAERVKRVINGYADKEATGGSFDFYTLGEPLFDENNNLNENVGIEKIREYVWFTETRSPLTPEGETDAGNVFMGLYNDTSYYFIYEKDNLTTLDYESLADYVQQKAERYIIYADNCLLPETFMREKNIEFKKIPRDITRF